VTFDISNHLITQVPLQDRLIRQAIQVRPTNETAGTGEANELRKAVLTLHSRLLTETAAFGRSEWLRQHRCARYHYIKPLLVCSGLAHRPQPKATEVRGPATSTPSVENRWEDMSPEQLHSRLCADLGLTPGTPHGQR
jgi:hypothetical protein